MSDWIDTTIGNSQSPDINQSIIDLTNQAKQKGVKYGFGQKDKSSGSIDCSGWSCDLAGNLGIKLNGSAAEIARQKSDEGLLSQDRPITVGDMIFGAGATHAKDRFNGIGHMGLVVQQGNKLYVSEATPRGPDLTPIEDFWNRYKDKGLYTAPLANQQKMMASMNQRLNELQQKDNQTSVGNDFYSTGMNFFINKGYSPAQAAGIVGNLMHESGGKTDISHDSGKGIGLAGWNGDRRSGLYQFAGTENPDLMQQLAYVDYELKNTEPKAFKMLQNVKTPEQAAQIFSQYFERPGKPMMGSRIDHARRAMNAYSMNQAESMVADVSGKATPSGDWVDSAGEWEDTTNKPIESISKGQTGLDKVMSYIPELPPPEQWNWKPAAQYGGMALGGLIGNALGPMGAVAGGTLGYGIGNELYNMISGQGKPIQTIPESLKYTGNLMKEGAENALMAETAIPAISKVAQIGGKLIKPTLGRLSTTGTKAIEKSLQGSEDFVKAYKGEISADDIVQNARDAIGILKDNRSLDYINKFNEIKNLPQEIDITSVKNKLIDLMKQFRVKAIDGELNFGTMAINDAGRKDVKKLIETIANWDDMTPPGVDALKRYVGDFYSDSSQARAFVTPLRKEINNLLQREIPGYHEMTKNYAEQSKLIFDIEKSLSLKKAELGGQATADQTLRRLMSAMKDNFKLRGDMIEALSSESGIDISSQVAGHAMNSILPHGLGGSAPVVGLEIASTIMHPKLALLFAASSPKIQGQFLQYWGKALREMSSMSEPLRKGISYSVPATREAIIKQKGEQAPIWEPSFQH